MYVSKKVLALGLVALVPIGFGIKGALADLSDGGADNSLSAPASSLRGPVQQAETIPFTPGNASLPPSSYGGGGALAPSEDFSTPPQGQPMQPVAPTAQRGNYTSEEPPPQRTPHSHSSGGGALGFPDRASKSSVGLADRSTKASVGLADRSTKASVGLADRAAKTSIGAPAKLIKSLF